VAFTAFKNIYRKHHSEDDERYKSLKDTMSLTVHENKQAVSKAAKALKSKNLNQVELTNSSVKRFISAVAFVKNPDIIDRIITCQICAGLRKIEVLSHKVSTFKKSKKDTDMIVQIGVAKQKNQKNENDNIKRKVKKPLVVITQDHFLQNIKMIREKVGDISEVSNKELGNKYSNRINKRIKKYLDALNIPDHKEISTSHGMRRLYANFAYANRKNKNMSLQLFITKYLGHDPEYVSSAAANYSSIHIEPAAIVSQSERESAATVAVSKKQKKFQEIEKLINSGKTTYEELQKAGITTYMYSKYKKEKNLQSQPFETRETPNLTVAQAVAKLTKEKKSATYANLRTFGFTNAQIKKYKSTN
jgi:hypothetical protein